MMDAVNEIADVKKRVTFLDNKVAELVSQIHQLSEEKANLVVANENLVLQVAMLSGDIGISNPDVLECAAQMEATYRDTIGDIPRDWKSMSASDLMAYLRAQVEDLADLIGKAEDEYYGRKWVPRPLPGSDLRERARTTVPKRTYKDIRGEAADVANAAWMVVRRTQQIIKEMKDKKSRRRNVKAT